MITYIIFTIFVFLLLIINFLIKKSYWYQAKFGDALKFKNIPKDLQIVNLGSNSGKFSFDYERRAGFWRSKIYARSFRKIKEN